jgi:hypothetical protein
VRIQRKSYIYTN